MNVATVYKIALLPAVIVASLIVVVTIPLWGPFVLLVLCCDGQGNEGEK